MIAWILHSSFLCSSCHTILTIPNLFLALLKISSPIAIILDQLNVLPAYTFFLFKNCSWYEYCEDGAQAIMNLGFGRGSSMAIRGCVTGKASPKGHRYSFDDSNDVHRLRHEQDEGDVDDDDGHHLHWRMCALCHPYERRFKWETTESWGGWRTAVKELGNNIWIIQRFSLPLCALPFGFFCFCSPSLSFHTQKLAKCIRRSALGELCLF